MKKANAGVCTQSKVADYKKRKNRHKIEMADMRLYTKLLWRFAFFPERWALRTAHETEGNFIRAGALHVLKVLCKDFFVLLFGVDVLSGEKKNIHSYSRAYISVRCYLCLHEVALKHTATMRCLRRTKYLRLRIIVTLQKEVLSNVDVNSAVNFS